jgi:MerR family copper efflux transcriptional regulator
MLRYRDSLGLLPAVRERAGRRAAGPPGGAPGRSPGHRRFGQHDLDAVALALAIEQRYDISPAALAFGLRVLADPAARAEVAELGRRIGRIQAPPARALDFEQERAHRLLRIPVSGPGRAARE